MEKSPEKRDREALESSVDVEPWTGTLGNLGFDEYGGASSSFLASLLQSAPAVVKKVPRAQLTTRQGASKSGTVCRYVSRFDFIQSIAGADETELNMLMKMALDVVSRECHPDRVIGGEVEKSLCLIAQRWENFCQRCSKLEEWLEKRNRRAREREKTRHVTEEKEREQKRIRTRAILLDRMVPGESRGKKKARIRDVVSEHEEEEYKELLETFGSDLLIDIGRTPEDLYRDTKNVRIGTIVCMLGRSKAMQRLACVGKFYSESEGYEYAYRRIPKQSLEEFIAFTDRLRHAFMTGQTSPGNFVKSIRWLVRRGGVHEFVHGVLDPARRLETIRLSVSSTV